MNTLTLNTQVDSSTTTISNTFIDTFMPMANGEFIKIYIYLLRCVSDRSTNVSISSLADVFNQTEADIMRALRYWDKAGALNLVFDNTGSRLAGITFCDLNSAQYNAAPSIDYTAVTPNTGNRAGETQTTVNVRQTTHIPSADNSQGSFNSHSSAAAITTSSVKASSAYTPSQIKELKKQDEFGMLLYAVGTYLGGELSPADTSTIAYIYDTLHFSAELIEYLVEYCISKDKKSMRYIEKVALNWAEEGIDTVKAAKAASSSHNDNVYAVMNAFGITNRNAGQVETDYICKWSENYNFDTAIIIEACNRTLAATHQPSFNYADSILTKWYNAGVKTEDDIRRMDSAYEQNRQNTYAKRATTAKPSNNKFNNFSQRNTDIDSLESSLLTNK